MFQRVCKKVFLKASYFVLQIENLKSSRDTQKKLIFVNGLHEIVGGSFLDAVNGRRNFISCSHDNDLDVRKLTSNQRKEFQAGNMRHGEVKDDQRYALVRFEKRQNGAAIIHGMYTLKSRAPQHEFGAEQDVRLVVHDQDFR